MSKAALPMKHRQAILDHLNQHGESSSPEMNVSARSQSVAKALLMLILVPCGGGYSRCSPNASRSLRPACRVAGRFSS